MERYEWKTALWLLLAQTQHVGRGIIWAWKMVCWRGRGALLNFPGAEGNLQLSWHMETPKEQARAHGHINGNVEVETMVLSATDTQSIAKIQSLLTFPLLSLCFEPRASLVWLPREPFCLVLSLLWPSCSVLNDETREGFLKCNRILPLPCQNPQIASLLDPHESPSPPPSPD